MIKIKNLILILALSLSFSASSVFAEETELEVSLGKSGTIVNAADGVEIDASVFFTASGYNTSNNKDALDAGLAINWGGRGYIDVDLECEAVISRVEWSKNHVFGALGLIKAYGANSADFSDMVLLGEVKSGSGTFSDETYYRYIRLEKAANYDFYPGKISVYGYKKPFVFEGMSDDAVNSDSVIELEFSEILSTEMNTENIQLRRNGAAEAAEAYVFENKILLSAPGGFVPGGIYEIVIPAETVVAEDTRVIGTELVKHFIVSTDELELSECTFENNVLSFIALNKTATDVEGVLWIAEYEDSVLKAVTEESFTAVAGIECSVIVSVTDEFAVYVLRDASKMQMYLPCFTNTLSDENTDDAITEAEAKYVDGAVYISGVSDSDSMTAVLIKEDNAVSAENVKAISTATVKAGKYVIKLLTDAESGNYDVWVSDGAADTPEKYSVYVLDETDKQLYAEQIAGMTEAELKVFFEDNANAKILSGIGIIGDRPENLSVLYKAIENAELSGVYTEIAKAINTCIALEITKEKGFVYGMEKYNDFLGVDTESELYKYVAENSLENSAEQFMKNSYTDVLSFNKEISDSFKLAVFTGAMSAEYAEEFAKDNNDFFGLDFDGDYSKLKAVNKKNVVNAAMNGESLEDIRDKFENAVSTYKKKESSKSSGGGGGGGRASTATSSKPEVVLPEVKVDELKTEVMEDIQKPSVKGFSDLPESHWAYKSVMALSEKGIVSGFENKFSPDNNVTREQFVKMLTEAAGIDKEGEIAFTDVLADSWYFTYVSRAFNAGIVNGISDTLFGTGGNITRQDMALMIYNTLNACGAEVSEAEEKEQFSDYESISGYARDAVEKLCGMGLINGRDDNSFAPFDFATRAEAAELIYRLLGEIN